MRRRPIERQMLIVNCVTGHDGWSPIHYLVSLAARLLGAEEAQSGTYPPSFLEKLTAIVNRRTRHAESTDTCLLVCAGPADLLRVLKVPGWSNRFRFIAAWIIDSFWLDHLPKSIRIAKPFDHFFVTCSEDIPEWIAATGTRTTWLPWGTDALRLGSRSGERRFDVTRVGRQPPEWDDDRAATAAAQELGLRYRGRIPGEGLTALQNQELMMGVYADSKYVLAFSNTVNPKGWTHPKRQYVTGRWVDALAAGATVAGIAPQSPDTEALLWPGATLELGGTGRASGLKVLAEACRGWTPEQAARNHAMALAKLDWRWRLKIIADLYGIAAPILQAELSQLPSSDNALKPCAGRS